MYNTTHDEIGIENEPISQNFIYYGKLVGHASLNNLHIGRPNFQYKVN